MESGLSLRDFVDDDDARSQEMLSTVLNYLQYRAAETKGGHP